MFRFYMLFSINHSAARGPNKMNALGLLNTDKLDEIKAEFSAKPRGLKQHEVRRS